MRWYALNRLISDISGFPSPVLPLLLQGTEGPKERMDEEEAENADQERGHEREGPEEHGILFPVRLLGVRVVSGKILRRVRVAGPAGRQFVPRGEHGSLVSDRENGMRTVAVGAFCHRLVPEAGHLSVKGLAVGIQLLRVTGTAFPDERELPLRIAGARDPVLQMTVKAYCS